MATKEEHQEACIESNATLLELASNQTEADLHLFIKDKFDFQTRGIHLGMHQ